MEKILAKMLFAVMAVVTIISVYTHFLNVAHVDKTSGNTEKNTHPRDMSESQIMDMLIADTGHINLFVECIQKIPKEIATILGLQKFNLEEIIIIQNSILKNFSELYGMAVAFEPYMFFKDKRFFSSYLYRNKEIIIETNLNDPAYDYFSQNWYLLPKIMQKPVWTSPAYDEGGGDAYMTTYAVPINFFDGEKETFSGIVTIDVSIDWLVTHFPENKVLPNNGIVTLIAEDGTILSTRNTAWVINETIFSLSELLKIPKLRSIGRAIQRGEHGMVEIYSAYHNGKIKIYYNAINANKWGLLYLIPDKPFVELDKDRNKG